ncbi:hypothetical protein KKG65_03275 [Patescibacteria group bacterium]|nr:hypothetical protein [Patescibacteria group bacterium]
MFARQSLVKLPTDMLDDTKATLKTMGVEFLGVVEDDPIFQNVRLPECLRLNLDGIDCRQQHSFFTFTSLLDEKDRKRFRIHESRIFYDYSAYMFTERRFGLSVDYVKRGVVVVTVIDGNDGLEIFRSTSLSFDMSSIFWQCYCRQATDRATQEAKKWLFERYPEWENPASYW